jgi:hypothetical protein
VDASGQEEEYVEEEKVKYHVENRENVKIEIGDAFLFLQ